MAHDLISKKTRYEFREYFVGINLREIEMEFDAADVPLDETYAPRTSGQRRSFVEKYYHSVDWTKWRDVRKVLTVYENVLSHLETLALPAQYQYVRSSAYSGFFHGATLAPPPLYWKNH
jgi:hypothetical protein